MSQRGEVLGMRKPRQVQATAPDFRTDEWLDNEVVACEFQDLRHGKRLRQLLEQFSGRDGVELQ